MFTYDCRAMPHIYDLSINVTRDVARPKTNILCPRKRGSKDHQSPGHAGSEGIGGGSVQGMFDGAMAGNPVLMITSMAM